jgi:hypothetical protein
MQKKSNKLKCKLQSGMTKEFNASIPVTKPKLNFLEAYHPG